ncbi:four helix bundle protein [Flaviaesturariibacter amylovorans]|uniref:Four helix bundle protein n=1 Tax=Flaviaesturariibacter amylovorans TaxID=1084520 RepID=A0ABP8H3Y0_9BACT
MYRLEELEVYELALKFSSDVWALVSSWDTSLREHPGAQLTAAADSISANIAEGYGRYYVRDNIKFCYYARGSIMECKDWLRKCAFRQLIDTGESERLLKNLSTLHARLNGYIKRLRKNLQSGVLNNSK